MIVVFLNQNGEFITEFNPDTLQKEAEENPEILKEVEKVNGAEIISTSYDFIERQFYVGEGDSIFVTKPKAVNKITITVKQ